MKNLPREQVEFLESAYRRAKKIREKQRLHALRLLIKGYKRKEVADILDISKQALGDWVTRYHKYGLSGLRDKPQPGNHHTLTKEQKQTIKELITTTSPDKLGYTGRFWNTDQLGRLVKEKYGVKYHSLDSYYRLFAFCGFSYHKPDKVNKGQRITTKIAFEEQLKKDWRGIAREMGWYW
jgi:transposase